MARVKKQLSVTNSVFKGIVFDLDGVIVDSHPLHKRAWRAFLAYLGKDVSEADLDFIFEGRKRREILIHFLGELSDSDIQLYGDKKDEFFRQASADLKPISGSVEFINNVRQAELSMAVATSASRQRAQWTLEQLELAECFGVVVSGDDVALGKPHPAIYRIAAQRLSVPPEFLLAVEDSVSGVRSAVSAGLRCIAIAPPENASPLIEVGAERVVPTLMNLSIQDLEEMFSSSRRACRHVTFQHAKSAPVSQ
ncbi:MAG: HAD family phosphatase [Acidobacteriia bacterium]|nr:HAD family phosphatase [Terriglobia bacterium]